MAGNRSESMSWRIVGERARQARDLLTGNEDRRVGQQLGAIARIADEMLQQVAAGVHTNPRSMRDNPALVIWPNPPGLHRKDALMSHRVYEIAYKHFVDGQDYKHEFSPGVWMQANKDNQVVLYRPDGKPLSKDF